MSPVTFAPILSPDPGIMPLWRALGSVFGADRVAWAGFTIAGGATPDWLLRHTLEGSRFDLGPLLLSDIFGEAVPLLADGVSPDRMASFESLSSYGLCGEIAEVLVAGGADLAGRMPTGAAQRVAHDGIDALIGQRCDEITVLRSRVAWSSWFACDVWDRTWVVADAGRGQVWLLCVTDVAPLTPPPAPTP